jgi:hypothetical protein
MMTLESHSDTSPSTQTGIRRSGLIRSKSSLPIMPTSGSTSTATPFRAQAASTLRT